MSRSTCCGPASTSTRHSKTSPGRSCRCNRSPRIRRPLIGSAPMDVREIRLSIQNEMDVARAALQTGSFCAALGFDRCKCQMAATAVSELGTNIIKYALRGEVILRSIVRRATKGLEIIAEDQGPGITNV